MQVLVTELARLERAALLHHYLALESEDRRLRFGAPLADSSIARYVERILARKQAMKIVVDAASYFGEVFQQRVALFDAALKRGRAWLGPGK